jgi:uncharacterized phage protein (TIGR02218 family)
MRSVGTDLGTFLDTHTTLDWFAELFTWTPQSGATYRWTNWASDLTVGGHTFTAAGTGTVPLIEVDGYKSSVGTTIETTKVTLYAGATAQFGGVRLPLAAASGAFDQCGLLVERVYMPSPGDVSLGTMHIFQGIVGDAEPSSSTVVLTVESGMAALNQVIPRTMIQAGCNNVLFDTICSAAGLTKASKTVTGTCSSGATSMSVPTSRTEADKWFELGVITFTSGVCSGQARGVVAFANASGVFTLDRPLNGTPANGDTFSVYPGCDKARNGGCAKFANLSQFRGFPFAPSKGLVYQQPSLPPRTYAHNDPTGVGWTPVTDVSTASYGKVLPIVYGRQRVPGMLVYVAPPGATTRPQNQGLATQIMALCQGVIDSVLRYWRNGAASTSFFAAYPYHAPDGSVNTGHTATGGDTQTPWSVVTDIDPAEALAYPGVAYVGIESAPYTPSDVDSRSFEVAGILYNGLGGAGDADPADVIADLISAEYGAAVTFDVVTDVGQDGNAASSFRRYATAENFGVSLLVDSQRSVRDILRDVLDATNSDVVWSDGAFKILPYADLVTSGNSVTFTPVTAPQYALTTADFLGADEDPVTATRGPTVDLYNTWPVEFLERSPVTWRPLWPVVSTTPDQCLNAGNLYQCITSGTTASSGGPTGTNADITDGSAHWKYLQAYDAAAAYNAATVESPDPVDVALNKIKRASPISAHALCNRDSAVKLSRLIARRNLYSRTVYMVRLGWRFGRIQPMDLLSLTEPLFGLNGQVVRVQTITERMQNGEPVYEIEAVEWPVGFCQAPSHLTGSNESANYVSGGDDMAGATVAGLVAAALSSLTAGSIPSSASNGWRGVAEATSGTHVGRLVAVGDQGGSGTGAAAYSDTQGRAWTSANLPSGTWVSVCFGNGLFVAVGGDGTYILASSPDGVTWTSRTVSGGGALYDVKWNGSVFVAVGASGNSYWSSNGTTWTAASMPTVNGSNVYRAVGWSPSLGLWLATGHNGASATAASAATSWTGRGIDTANNPELTSVAWSDALGLFLVAGFDKVYALRDGIAWSAVPFTGMNQLTVVWGGRVALVMGSATTGAMRDALAYSFDGLAWTILDVAATPNGGMQAATWVAGSSGLAGKFVMVGSAGGGSGPECLTTGSLPR